MKVLVTGAAGFIGMHVSERLLMAGHDVCGVDNLNDYYDVSLKAARLKRLVAYPNFRFERLDLADVNNSQRALVGVEPDFLIHLAAQAGVRYSIDNPQAYAESDLVGFVNILEVARHARVRHLVYASSSSVYGRNTKIPFAETDDVDSPVSLYAATKRANELMAHTYSHLFQLRTTGLRFFTVYGPWGRPDMAYYLFVAKILAGKEIDVYNFGQSRRDFTYISDIVDGVVAVMASESGEARADIVNIGGGAPVLLNDFIETIEGCIGKRAVKRLLPLQPGDVPTTYADTSRLEAMIGKRPETPLGYGLGEFVRWYREYHEI